MRNNRRQNQSRDVRGNNGGRQEERRLTGQGPDIGGNGRTMAGSSHSDSGRPNGNNLGGRSRKKK